MSSQKLSKCFFGIILFSACAAQVDVEQESENLLQTDVAFAEASVQVGAAEAFYTYLTDDAMQLPRNGDPVVGREQIRDSMSQGPMITLTWEPQKAEVAKAGDLGWTWGTYTVRWDSPDGEENVRHGKYVNIWKKQPDGQWKVALDMGNQSSSPPATTN